jgi:hypothetical protein
MGSVEMDHCLHGGPTRPPRCPLQFSNLRRAQAWKSCFDAPVVAEKRPCAHTPTARAVLLTRGVRACSAAARGNIYKDVHALHPPCIHVEAAQQQHFELPPSQW